MMTKRERIVGLLREYEGDVLPEGVLAAVGRQVGCTREYVRQVAIANTDVRMHRSESVVLRARRRAKDVPRAEAGAGSAAVFAANLRRYRLRAGHTQATLGAAIGTWQGTIARIEQGKRGTSAAMRDRLAEALGVSVATLMRP